MSSSRKASHAGSWYTSDGKYMSLQIQYWYFFLLHYNFSVGSKLDRELGGWLDNAEKLHAPARAIIAPYPNTSCSMVYIPIVSVLYCAHSATCTCQLQ